MQHRLLVIEDDRHIAELVCRIAKAAGFEVRSADTLDQIKYQHRHFAPDVIVLDVLMPEVDGFDVLNYLHEQDSQAKIVLLSGSASYRDMAEKMGTARGLSVVANLAKPFRAPSLRLALEEIRQHLVTFRDASIEHQRRLPA